MRWVIAAVGIVLGTASLVRAQPVISLEEVVGSWQGDDEIQYVELRMNTGGVNGVANVAALVFDDAKGSDGGRRTAIFLQNVPRGIVGAKILVASTKARDLADVQPDFLLPAGFLRPKNGRVCFAVKDTFGVFQTADCVAYGKFTGDNAPFGAPTTITPDNRALQRTKITGKNRADWVGALDPVLENNVGATGTLPATLCGDNLISQGEECDGTELADATCESLGFAKGKLVCTQCHYDTTKCTDCGNDVVDGKKEECDGGDFGDRTCATLGYTGGSLSCSEECTLSIAGCDPSFFVPGGGSPKTDCTAEWRIANTTGGPNSAGKVAAKQRCKDGDPGCDADGAADGTCTFTIAACFNRTDARLAKCTSPSVEAWTLLGKVDPANPGVATLVSGVAALGPSTVDGVTVTFATALTSADLCTEDAAFAVPVRGKLNLKSRSTAFGGKPKDTDVVKLSCQP
jgi:hypothetical protein